jgi:hypothetical protein
LTSFLPGRAALIGVSAENTAYPYLRFQDSTTTGAVVGGNSVVFGHFFLFGKTTDRAGNDGVSLNHPGILPKT